MSTTALETLSLRTLLEINAALSSLDGTPTAVTLEDKTEKIITVPYTFSGAVRWNISKNLSLLKRVSEQFSTTRDALIFEVSGGSGKIEQTDEVKIKAFNDKLNEVLNTQEHVQGLLKLPLSGLNLDTNQISPAILSILQPIITE
jgi:hypothetical protein